MTQTRVYETNIEMVSGDSKLLNVTVLDQDDNVVDITGASVSMTISVAPGETPLMTKAGSVVSGPSGTLTVDLAPTDTDDLAGVYWYEIQMTDVSSRISTIVLGWLTIKRDSTP